MADLKTKPNRKSVHKFLNSVENDRRREDAFALLEMMQEITGEKPVMWGDSIVGFGSYPYTNTSGSYRWMLTGFSPRKASMSVYIMTGFKDYKGLLAKLGKCKSSVSCLYINKLEDIDLNVLRKLITKSADRLRKIEEP